MDSKIAEGIEHIKNISDLVQNMDINWNLVLTIGSFMGPILLYKGLLNTYSGYYSKNVDSNMSKLSGAEVVNILETKNKHFLKFNKSVIPLLLIYTYFIGNRDIQLNIITNLGLNVEPTNSFILFTLFKNYQIIL